MIKKKSKGEKDEKQDWKWIQKSNLVFFGGKTFVRDTWNSLVTAAVQQKILSSVLVEIVSVILELDMHLFKTLKEKKVIKF